MKEPSELTGAIERTLHVLQCVAENGSFTAKDIATQVGIPTSTAYRLLQTLGSMNFVERASHGSYLVGREYLRLASLVVSTSDYETICEPYLQELSQQFQETCSFALYLPKQYAFTIVRVIPALHPLQFVVQRFTPRSMMLGALGKVMLPFLPREDVAAALEKQEEFTEFIGHVMTMDMLLAEFEDIHRRGCYVGISPSALGANSTAAPVFNSKGQILGSIGITVPNVRFDPALQPEISAAVMDAARQLSSALGYGERTRLRN